MGKDTIVRNTSDINLRNPLSLKAPILTAMRSLYDFAWTHAQLEQSDSSMVSNLQACTMPTGWKLPDHSGWYAPLQPIYDKLERYAAINNNSLTLGILEDPNVQALLPTLYALRAQYEYDLEYESTHHAIASDNPRAFISSQVDKKIRSLPDAYYNIMRPADKILFAGSGPLPTTALALTTVLRRPITCIDYNPEANEIAREYIKLAGSENLITFLDGDLLEFDGFNRFNCVAGAFLIGMSRTPAPLSAKADFVGKLLAKIDGFTSVVLRTSRELGGIIYPLIDFEANSHFQPIKYPLQMGKIQTYDSTFVTWN